MEEDIEMHDEIVNNFSSDEEGQYEGNQDNMIDYNPSDFEFENIYNKLTQFNILRKAFNCTKCGKEMKIVNDNSTLDRKIFRCRGNNPKHDCKTNIRKDSIYEDFQIPLFILYYLTFECFAFNKSVSKSLLEINEICIKINKPSTSIKIICKLFKHLREKLRKKFHEHWKLNPLGAEPSNKGVPRVEIDESEIIDNQDKILWMFGMIDRADKEARVFCVMNNRTKENIYFLLLKIIFWQIMNPEVNLMMKKKKKTLKLGFIQIVFHPTSQEILKK